MSNNKVVINSCYGGFSLSDSALAMLAKRKGLTVSEVYSLTIRMERHDLDLIEVVETLGKRANTEFSDLKVKQIAGHQYKIGEYDGFEWLQTPESMEWISIHRD